MPLPDSITNPISALLTSYCEQRIPTHARDKVRLRFAWRNNTVTLIEQRPHFLNPETWIESPIAQFRFDPSSDQWSLHYRDRNQRWLPFPGKTRHGQFTQLLSTVDDDPMCIFWG